MSTALNTWARLRAPVLCITGTGSGTGIPLAKGGKIVVSGVVTDTYSVEYEGPVFLGENKSMLRTDFNPFNITGSSSMPSLVRTPYFTGNNTYPFALIGSFVEWQMQSGVGQQTLTEDQKDQLIGQTVTTTTTSFTMTAAAFTAGQTYTPGGEYIVSIGNLTEV
jgi:hypothetical protein